MSEERKRNSGNAKTKEQIFMISSYLKFFFAPVNEKEQRIISGKVEPLEKTSALICVIKFFIPC